MQLVEGMVAHVYGLLNVLTLTPTNGQAALQC